jgi:membrane protein DedA with SNARE-associated domain
MSFPPNAQALALAFGIVGSAFLTEDGATVTAATLAASCLLDTKLAFLSAFGGLWIGDLGVFVLARFFGPAVVRHPWFSRIFRNGSRAESGAKQGAWELAVSRFFPGTRLPSYLTAGLRAMPVWLFTSVTATTAFLWTFLVFLLIRLTPVRTTQIASQLPIFAFVGAAVFALLHIWRIWGTRIRDGMQLRVQRLSHWEFWPAWLFYPPVALYCLWQGIRYGSFSLPAIANLNQKNGGIIGESKIEILKELMRSSPEFTAEAFLIDPGPVADRMARLEALCLQHRIALPFILKPNIAQRGSGFRKIKSMEEVSEYLSRVSIPVVLQRYVLGPKEAGIFYYRFPGKDKGHILGVTRKEFPHVIGDGVRTLRELIEADPRARLIAPTYLRRFGTEADRVLWPGERFRLVEAGNHCQGCEFRDGSDLCGEELLNRFDSISRNLRGFFVGRFDVRYSTDDDLREGKNFFIIELNGAASEATNIYDSRNSLRSAYATLFRQWRIVYAIGANNRRLGSRPPSPYAVWRDWREFAKQACEFPLAD